MHKIKIQTKKLNFYYGKYCALLNINLDIHSTCVTACIGPSGGGKSTLLRTFNKIYDLYPANKISGEILLDPVNILNPSEDTLYFSQKSWDGFSKTHTFSHIYL